MALLAGRDRRAHLPRPLDGIGAKLDGNAAAFRSRDAQIDVRERPLLAIALVVDAEIAALEANLGEIVTIQRPDIETFDPGKQRCKLGSARTRVFEAGARRLRQATWTRARLRCGRAGDDWSRESRGGNKWAFVAPAKTVSLLSSSIRTAISAPTKLKLSARIRPNKRLRPEMPSSALGALATTVPSAIAHDNVANAQRRPTVRIALELGASDLDFVPVAEIFLDCRREPWGCDIERDRTN